MLIAQLNSEQRLIIQDICDLQIQSLIKVSMRPVEQITPQEKQAGVSELLKNFCKLKLKPAILFSLDKHSYSLFKHCLLHNHERYYAVGESANNLWEKVIVREMHNPIMS